MCCLYTRTLLGVKHAEVAAAWDDKQETETTN
jgi:hypothetical protein